MASPWTEKCESWMLRRGVLIRDVPREPMSPRTVKVYMKGIRKCLRRARVLGPEDQVLKRANNLRPEDLINYFEKAYPRGPRGQESKWNNDARALRKLAEWLHFDMKHHGYPTFSVEDLELIRKEIYLVSVPKPRKGQLSRDFLARFEDQFLPWLRENDTILWGPTVFMYHTGLRIHEVAGMDVDLATGTVIRLDDGKVQVHGKGSSGHVREDPIPLTDMAERHLDNWAPVRAGMEVETEALFPGHAGGRLDTTGSFNRHLRLAGKRSGLFSGDCNEVGATPTGELKLLHAHAIGRGAFITNMNLGGIHPLQGMKLSRHKKIDVYQDYDRSEADEAVRMVNAMRRSRDNGNGNGNGSDHSDEPSLKDMILQAVRELPEDEKRDLGMALFKELMG